MKKLIRLGLLILLAFLFFRLASAVFSGSRREDQALLTNRVWVAHLPKDERDMVPHLFLFEKSGYRGGAFGIASMWRIETSRLRYRYEPPKLDLELPQRRVKGQLDVRIGECKEAPKPFDLCLELSEGKRKLQLYSRRKWRMSEGGPEGFEDSAFERRLGAWAAREKLGEPPKELESGPLVEAPDQLLFPGR